MLLGSWHAQLLIGGRGLGADMAPAATAAQLLCW
jgi:hypothetical protein